MPFRVERIVNAMDLDDSGTVHLTELAQFSEPGGDDTVKCIQAYRTVSY